LPGLRPRNPGLIEKEIEADNREAKEMPEV